MIAMFEAPARARLVTTDSPGAFAARWRDALRTEGVVVRTRRARPRGEMIDVVVELAGAELLLPARVGGPAGAGDHLRFEPLADQIVAALGRGAGASQAPPAERWVVLDPLVERVADRKPGLHMLLTPVFHRAMIVPEGDGLIDLVEALREPAEVAELCAGFDDDELVEAIVNNLVRRGFAYFVGDPAREDIAFDVLRHLAAGGLAAGMRASVEIDLDLGGGDGDAVMSHLAGAAAPPPAVTLSCDDPAAHRSFLERVARSRRSGTLRLHDLVLVTRDVEVDHALGEVLFALGARIRLAEVGAPGSLASLAGGAGFLRHRLSVCPTLAISPTSLTQDAAQAIVSEITERRHAGLALKLEGTLAIESAGLAALFDRVDAMEDALGDIEWLDLASDEEILGNTRPRTATLREHCDPGAPLAQARRLHLERLTRMLRRVEHRTMWAQVPEAEALWIKPGEDLIPNNPSLLGLAPGAQVVDVCGGMGRVARRLAPHVGREGSIVSIEMEGHVVERARRFAAMAGFGWIQFRKGLAQRIPLPDACADAVINEWTGAIWQLGLGPAMLGEMARIVRPGGRVAVTHRIVLVPLEDPTRPSSSIPGIYRLVKQAFAATNLVLVEERVWGQTLPQCRGAPLRWMIEQYLPRLVDSLEGTFEEEDPERADIYLTLIARRP
ncbi:MAG TPA: methyltransferase domain-containing protein [Kofleriaceae bacterium]|nr:methyltransferase domain-containing protein [Kofleriaceae bacterium]